MKQRYLVLEIFGETEEETNLIIEGLRTTAEEKPIVTEDGLSYTTIVDDNALMAEAFCLGVCFAELEQQGIQVPFLTEVVELDVPPIGI